MILVLGAEKRNGIGERDEKPSSENSKELKKLLEYKEQLEYSLDNSSINAMDTSKRYWVTQDQWDSNQLQLQQLNEKIKSLEPEQTSAQLAPVVVTADVAKVLYGSGPPGRGDYDHLKSGSAVVSVGGDSSSATFNIQQKSPAGASDGHTTAQKRIGLQGRYAN